MDPHLVDEPSLQELAPEARPAYKYDVSVAGGCSRLREHALDTAGDKRERASARVGDRLMRTMRQHEHR
jgi:hypothetical protein